MDLSSAFPPELARFGRSLCPFGPGALPLPGLLAGLRGGAEAGPDRARLSLWSQHYLLALVPPVLAAAVGTDRAPCLRLDGSAVLLGPDGMPEAVCLSGLERRGRGDLVGALLCDHLLPLAGRLAEAGLPAPVLWSNAGYVISWTLRVLRAPGTAELLLKLQSPFWSGQANPLPPGPRAALASGGRSVCCLRFRLHGMARCAECPRTVPSRPA